MTHLFDPMTLRGVTTRNRVWVSPMCQYSSVDGMPHDWHLAHLGARATGGARLGFTQASPVTAEGRVSRSDAGGLDHGQALARSPVTPLGPGQGAGPGGRRAPPRPQAPPH